MSASLAGSSRQCCTDFRQVVEAFLSQPGLPFANVLSAERIERIFAKHGNLFGMRSVYSTVIMIWAFLGQVLRDGKQASCQAAVANISCYYQMNGQEPPTADTGDYCRARAKLSEEALRDLSCEVADQLEESADESWLFEGMHAKLIDGFTFTMPDTRENQKVFPHPKTQTPGVGLPISRAVVIVSLATAAVMDVAIGPYKGKETGETALLRSVMDSLAADDIAVFDRYYCSFMMIAMLQSQGTHVCARLHHRRKSDFRRGKRLGKYDHIIEWTRPPRPEWMDETTYSMIPKTLKLREIRYQVVEKGRRTKEFTVVTTLRDPQEYSKEAIAQLYGFRWNVELDVRSIKDSLNLGHVRCKSPAMVRRELWTTILGYNLIRTTGAAAALLHNQQPRQISFTSTCQYVLASWMLTFSRQLDPQAATEYCRAMLNQIATCVVANRPGRLEPRVIKRRRHGYKLMRKPRHELRDELRKVCT